MRKGLFITALAMVLLLLVFAAAEETGPQWTEAPYDEANRLWQWNFGELSFRIPGYYEVRGSGKSVIGSTVAYDDLDIHALSFRIEHIPADSKTGKTVQQNEKKGDYDKALAAVIDAEFDRNTFDRKLGSREPGTPENVIVYRTPQIRGTTWCSAYAAIRADGAYFILACSAYKAETAREGLDRCLSALTWKGIRLRFDTLKEPVPYTDGYESELRIQNPMRKAAEAPVSQVRMAEGSVPAGWQRCNINEYGIMFSCPPGVSLLTADSPDEEWEQVLDLRLYRQRLAEAVKLLAPPAGTELEAARKIREENARIAFSALMAQKRSYEDGSCLDLFADTVALIAPEGAVDWNMKINISAEKGFPENQKAEEKILKPLLEYEEKADGYYGRTVTERGYKEISGQVYAYLYDSSPFLSHIVYITCYRGRRIDVVLTVTQPKRAEYLDLVPFAEDVLGHFRFLD